MFSRKSTVMVRARRLRLIGSIAVITGTFSFNFNPLLAAPRPLTWRADFPSARVENFPVRHGTDVDFRPSWYVNGVPADTNGWTYSLSVQTNGAPAGEWAIIPGAVFSHTNDCGADAYNVLVRAVDRDGTVDYSAAARIRMLPSPGFSPGALPPMVNFHESDPVFSSWLSTFTIPETSLEPSTNYTDRSLSSFAATGTVARAASYGTPTRWTDATGCVWEVVGYGNWTQTEGAEGFSVMWFSEDDLDYYYTDQPGWYIISGRYYPLYGGDADDTEVSGYPDPVGYEDTLDSPRCICKVASRHQPRRPRCPNQ